MRRGTKFTRLGSATPRVPSAAIERVGSGVAQDPWGRRVTGAGE